MSTSTLSYGIRDLQNDVEKTKLLLRMGIESIPGVTSVSFSGADDFTLLVCLSFDSSEVALKVQRKVVRFLMKGDGKHYGVLSQSTNLSELHKE
jgi:hypothetical protein